MSRDTSYPARLGTATAVLKILLDDAERGRFDRVAELCREVLAADAEADAEVAARVARNRDEIDDLLVAIERLKAGGAEGVTP